jgi:acetyl-CoA carboxylase biotin carboxyl carrier protein
VSLTAADVAEIMRLVEQSSFDELTLEIDGMKLTLRRNGAGQPMISEQTEDSGAPAAAPSSAVRAEPPTPGTGVSRRAAAAPAAAPTVEPQRADPNVQDVAAPLLGTFYRAPKPGAPPFVEIGSMVEADTVVAIIEVMKLMNTVRAGVRGAVSEILVADGALVEYGQAILRVRKTG